MLDTQMVFELLDDKREEPTRLRSMAVGLVNEGWRNQVNEWFAMDHNKHLAEQLGWRVKEKAHNK